MSDKKTFYSIKEVSERLRVAVSTVHRYIADGLLDAYQIGGRGPWRVRAESFEKFEAEYK